MLERHVFITGMPGSGKSSIGRKAASMLRLPFLDMDREISDALGGTVTEIFERYGEDGFRNAETNLLIRLAGTTPSLISTGGGTVLRPFNRQIMQSWGLILLVDRPLEDILSDIKLDRRPLLAAKGLGEVERLYAERIDIYRSTADLVLSNGNGYDNGIAEFIRLLRTRFDV